MIAGGALRFIDAGQYTIHQSLWVLGAVDMRCCFLREDFSGGFHCFSFWSSRASNFSGQGVVGKGESGGPQEQGLFVGP